MKRTIVMLMTCMPLLIMAQGIQWTTGLSFEQVKQKAKQENKYIFLDCFTTWCGPCKKMDKEVFPNDTLGVFMNDKFISVKVQMDETSKDNNDTKSWYSDVKAINNQYRISSFPTYIFLTPEGAWVHKEVGYNSVKQFLDFAQKAIQPGHVYIDPNEILYTWIDDYQNGERDFSKMPLIIKRAGKVNYAGMDFEVLKAIRKEYRDHLEGLKEPELYTVENIEFLNSALVSRKSHFFEMFYKNGGKIDAVMKQKGYAARVIDNTIKAEIILPFFNEYGLSPSLIMNNKTDTIEEPDWNTLHDRISKQYNKEYTERTMLYSKMVWYDQHHNFQNFAKYFLRYLDKNGVDKVDTLDNKFTTVGWINWHSWDIFEQIDNKDQLKSAARWMKEVIKLSATSYTHYSHYPLYLDTYANLLYKIGQKSEAILWEEKALQFANAGVNAGVMGFEELIKDLRETLNNMKKDKPTWNKG